MVYTALRDANELERHMMSICPQWHAALQHHLFWNQAIALIDPTDALGHHQIITPKNVSLNSSAAAALPTRISPFYHFRNITRVSCFVCRVNAPNSTMGLANAKRFNRNPYLHTIAVCRDHDRRPASYCGMCLQAAPVYDAALVGAQAAAAAQHEHTVGVVDNDDKETFPNVEATCRSCRTEWLWKRASETPGDREAIGGHRFDASDWETRNVVESFLDLAEGSIKDVLLVAREKLWLKKNTRLDTFVKMAKKTSKMESEGFEGLERYEEEESSDSEDDIEALQTDEGSVRDMALCDWARARILDGHWISPADTWYNHTVYGYKDYVPAMHPCPWTCSPSDGSSQDGEPQEHPLPATLKGTIPPTYGLCEQAFGAHQRVLKEVLSAPLKNLVRKIVIECQTPGMGYGRGIEDPAIKAAKMSVEEVLAALRNEEGVWLDGFDWVQRRMNESRERDTKRRNANTSVADSDDSSASSGSRSSNGTSPVLSTTTLQTTPSPPPLQPDDEKKEEISTTSPEASSTSEPAPVAMIEVGHVLDPPKPLHTVPYIPLTAAHFPPYTLDAVKLAWREACTILYRCRCSICLRATARANAGSHPQPNKGKILVPTQTPTEVPLPVKLSTVKLEEAIDVDGEGEQEIEEDEEDTYDEEEEEEGTDDLLEEVREYEELDSRTTSEVSDVEAEVDSSEELISLVPPTLVIPRPRKRSSDELELDASHEDEARNDSSPPGSARSGTPPKRARTGEREPPPHHVPAVADSPRRMRKRSSEELEEADGDELLTKSKKIKVSRVGTPSSVRELVSESPPPTTTSDFSTSRPSSPIMSTDPSDSLKYKPGDPLNPYDPASISTGSQGVFDRIAAGKNPLSSMDPEILRDPAKLANLAERLKQTMLEDAKERERTGETMMEQMLREKAEWAAQDAKAAALKKQGNAAFSKGDYKEAFLIYSACADLNPPESLYCLNRAAAGLKLKLFSLAEKDAGTALKKGNNAIAKAYFRRAQARKSLGKLSEAAKDLQDARKLQKNDASIEGEIAEVNRLLALPEVEREAWVTDQGAASIEDIFYSCTNMEEQVDAIVKREI
ncbi:hypothetical protein DXG01_006639 [Tephrocybe rancida]|nr:hypothetical protein DXG01_006639 [Tephrocybe rancida]